ncbi:MAG: TraR/DksA family transcriptional regulator [Puniceicoccaceae bacterium]
MPKKVSSPASKKGATPKKATQKTAPTKKVAAKKAPAEKAASVKKTANKTANKTVNKKAQKKAPAKKVTRKTAGASAGSAKKKAAPATAAKKTTNATAKRSVSKSPAGKAPSGRSSTPKPTAAEHGTLSLRLTAALSKVSSSQVETDGEEKRGGPAFFTLEDVREIIANRRNDEDPIEETVVVSKKSGTEAHAPTTPTRPKQSFGAVSMADILGFNPFEEKPAVNLREDDTIPKKFADSYKALIELRESVEEGLNRHSKESLGISNRDDSGDLSSYSQHMADAGTESFERDFALSLVSSEQDALKEIDEAIERIRNGTYGICEITGKPISKERLKAVPFARYSVEGQIEIEKTQRRRIERGGIFSTSAEDLANFAEEDIDE